MKRKLLVLMAFYLSSNTIEAQNAQYWSNSNTRKGVIATDSGVSRINYPAEFQLFQLDINPLREELFSIVGDNKKKDVAIITLPNASGQMEEFEVYEASNFEPDLQAQYPEIRAYSGKGITDKNATLKLSISHLGVATMVFRMDRPTEFMEVYSQDRTIYSVYKSNRLKGKEGWSCNTDEKLVKSIADKVQQQQRSSAGQLKVMRLAQSCDADYSVYFQKKLVPAATVGVMATSLAAINTTLTRCNGVYEKDLALHLNLVASSTNMIFLDPATDIYPAYNSNNRNWNKILQNNLSSRLTGTGSSLAANNAAYDIGHMFGSTGGGGDAGCIGCVCEDDTSANNDLHKGSGITSPADAIPEGDNFDIDYVVHEVGHQLGGNHTYTIADEGTGVGVEVGSGITIMGYAGITAADFVPHSIDAYHAVTIAQIQANLGTVTCPITTVISARNATPAVAASANITIPISTPFALVANGTDTNAADVLTYSWEQMDVPNAAQFVNGVGSSATINKPSGPNFASWAPTTSSTRYFPKMTSIMANSAVTAQVGGDAGMQSEALLSIARTLNFRVTVRDNASYVSTVGSEKVGQTNFANMTVTTNATGGAFSVSSQGAAGISYIGGTSQTVTWVPGSTASAPFNAVNVDILISYDSGATWTMLLAATPNDGTQAVVMPNPATDQTNCRIMVRSAVTSFPQSYFFDVNNNAFTITRALSNESFVYTDLSVFPNPSSGVFNIKFTPNSNAVALQIVDMRGRRVFEKSYTVNNSQFAQEINLSNVQSGVYLLSIVDGANKVVKRIVIQ